MFFSCKFTLRMFQHGIRNFCPKIVRNDGKSVQKLIIWNFKVWNFLQVMYNYYVAGQFVP